MLESTSEGHYEIKNFKIQPENAIELLVNNSRFDVTDSFVFFKKDLVQLNGVLRISAFNSGNTLNSTAGKSLVTNSTNALELRIESLEKHVAELASKVK